MRRKKGRPPVNKRRQRRTSSFLTKSLEDINNEIKAAYGKVTAIDKMWETHDKVTKDDAEEVFMQYRGRCGYCLRTLSYLGRQSHRSARLMWYVPLNVGGQARLDNLVLVCTECKNNYHSTRRLREDIQGVDSFADTCEALFIAVRDGADQVSIDRLKNRLNLRLSDVATTMRYVVNTHRDEHEIMVEGKNTIPDMLEDMAKGEDVKPKITKRMKKVQREKQYKVIRDVGDE